METSCNQNVLTNISEIQISYQPEFKASERPMITTSVEIYEVIKGHWNTDTIALKEEFKILLLNRNNRVLGLSHIGIGGMHGVYVDPKLIFATALKSWAASIALIHNHPSGGLKPSPEDINFTHRLVDGGKLLGILIIDHLIITPDNRYYSFADEGLI